MRGRLVLAGVAASFGLVFVPGLTSAADAATCGYPAVSCAQPQLATNNGSNRASTTSGQDTSAAVSPSNDAPTPTGSLPFTGADVAELSAIGVAALGAGTLLVRRGRHRHA